MEGSGEMTLSAKPIQAKSKPSLVYFFYLKKCSRHTLPSWRHSVTRIYFFPLCHVELGREAEQEECGDNCIRLSPNLGRQGSEVSTAGGARKSRCFGP